MRNLILTENVRLHLIETNKFKDVSISLRFMNQLSQRSATIRTLLSFMLLDRCQKYDTKQAVTNVLDNLYGASIDAKTMVYGQAQAIELKIRALNEHFIKESILEKQFALLHEFIYAPLMENDLFSSVVFEEAKFNMKSLIQRRIDNPSLNAMIQCSQITGEGYALGINNLGSEEILDSLSIDEVTHAYYDFIKNDIIDIFVVGYVEWEKIEFYVKRFFPFKSRNIAIDTYYQLPKQPFRQKQEAKQIDQTMLSMLANVKCDIHSENYWHTRVANSIFGQLPTSLLFQEVRERRSLCYSISSSMLPYDGMISINTGIEKKEVENVINLIKEQLKRTQTGDFSDEILQTSKEMMINSILSAHDDVSSLINFGYQNILLDRNISLEDSIEKIKVVTKNDVIKAFKEVELCTIFVLEQE